MRHHLVAVFGHYDSRGGATGVIIPDRAQETIKAACRYYITTVFGLDGSSDETDECAKNEFMWLADLWVPDDLEVGSAPGEGVELLYNYGEDWHTLIEDDVHEGWHGQDRRMEVISAKEIDWDAIEARRNAVEERFLNEYDVYVGFNSKWTPEQQAAAEDLKRTLETIDADMDQLLAFRAKVLTGEQGPIHSAEELGEDAWGFVLMEMPQK
jgi:hypothetical protein